VKIDSIQKHQTELSGEAVKPDGYVWLFQRMDEGCPMSYAYTEEEKAAAEAAGAELIETIPWKVGKLYTDTVARDRGWFESTKEMRDRFWADVEKARAGSYTPVESSRPRGATQKPQVVVTKEGAGPVCMIMEDDADADAVAAATI